MPAKTRKRNEANYHLYIHKVLKKVHPNLSIQQKSIAFVNSLVEHLVKELTKKSANVTRAARKSTVQARHMQAAAKLILPGDLANQAVRAGRNAATAFSSQA